MKAPQNLVLTAMAVFLAAGCSATHHAQDVRAADDTDRITVGTVQKEITLGMSAADVAAVLGSPNIVTTEEADIRQLGRWCRCRVDRCGLDLQLTAHADRHHQIRH